MKFKILFFLAFVFFAVQIIAAQGVPVMPGSYRLGPGDEINVKVLGEESYNFATTVNEDGKIDLPFADQPVMAKCRTEREVSADIKARLSKYLISPQLYINLKSNSRPPTVVTGEVRSPNNFTLMRKVSLLEMISLANGPTDDAGGMIQVVRPQPPMCTDPGSDADWSKSDVSGVPSRLYSASSLNLGKEESNPTIYPGDLILVLKAKPVYVVGEVMSPNGVYIKERGLSLMDAVSKVGGTTHDAKVKDVKIYRVKANSNVKDEISANLELIKKGQQKDIMLEPYDIVEVGKKVDSLGVTIMKVALGLGKTALTSTANMGGSRVIY